MAEGRVQLSGRTVTGDIPLPPQTIVAYDMPDFDEPPADLDYRIIHEDRWILGIDKPGNLLVHRQGRSFTRNLIYQLRHVHTPPWPNANIVNRLDRETSGVVLAALEPDTLRLLHRQMMNRQMSKRYIALVRGIPGKCTGEIDLALGKDTTSRIGYKQAVGGEKAKEALTRYSVTRTYRAGYSLVEVEPVTGRTHQIRVHMAAIGHPLVGDKLYGMDEEHYLRWRDGESAPEEFLLFPRQALHCCSLNLCHPATGQPCTLTAPLPGDIHAMILRIEGRAE